MPSLISQAMTGPSSPVPYVASASSQYTGRDAWKAFDKSSTTEWMSAGGALPQWLQIDLGAVATATSYRITAPSGSAVSRTPVDWTVKGSSDGASWTVVDTQAAVVWTEGETREFTVASSGSFRYYRLDVTKNGGNAYVMVMEWDLLGPAPAASADLAGTFPAMSGAFGATYAPPPPSGSIAGTFPGLTGSFAAVVPVVAALSGDLPALTGAMAGASYPVVGTDDTYASDGYGYTGVGLVDYDPPVAPTPARIRRSKVQRVHQSLPAPTLVDGRPT